MDKAYTGTHAMQVMSEIDPSSVEQRLIGILLEGFFYGKIFWYCSEKLVSLFLSRALFCRIFHVYTAPGTKRK